MSDPEPRVERHESPLGSWELVTPRPSPHLRGVVARTQGYVQEAPPFGRQRQFPGLGVPLILNFDAPLLVGTPGSEHMEAQHAFVAGLDDRYGVTGWTGPTRGLQVDLTPFAARRIFGVPMAELSGRTVALDDLLGPAAVELAERLREARDWPACFAVAENAIERRLCGTAEPPAAVVHAWNVIRSLGGCASVDAVADAVGWTRQHLAAQFREHVGLSPKGVMRLARFNQAGRMLDAGSESLAGIAVACGYYDQAHLSREFQAFAGASPTGLLRRRMPEGGGDAYD